MAEATQKPVHPGDVLNEVYMKSFDPPLTVSDVAHSIDVPAQELTRFLVGKRPITRTLATRLALRFRTTTTYWIGLQASYDRSQAAKLFRVLLQNTERPRL
ncbi:MAG: HigA family addiction module antitoxin [Nitrospira sp.]|nr:HigA family addiction module antidote protein [Nitrospira sp.]